MENSKVIEAYLKKFPIVHGIKTCKTSYSAFVLPSSAQNPSNIKKRNEYLLEKQNRTFVHAIDAQWLTDYTWKLPHSRTR